MVKPSKRLLKATCQIWAIQSQTKDGLCRTRVVDHLVGKEKLWIVVSQSFWLLGRRHPFEEENESVDRSKRITEFG